jgi:hypothetical protein
MRIPHWVIYSDCEKFKITLGDHLNDHVGDILKRKTLSARHSSLLWISGERIYPVTELRMFPVGFVTQAG